MGMKVVSKMGGKGGGGQRATADCLRQDCQTVPGQDPVLSSSGALEQTVDWPGEK